MSAVTWRNVNTRGDAANLAVAARVGQNIQRSIGGVGQAFIDIGNQRKVIETDEGVAALMAAAPEDRPAVMQGLSDSGISMDADRLMKTSQGLSQTERAEEQLGLSRAAGERAGQAATDAMTQRAFQNKMAIQEHNQTAERNLMYGGAGTILDQEGNPVQGGQAVSAPGATGDSLNFEAMWSGAKNQGERGYVANSIAGQYSSGINPPQDNSGAEAVRYRNDVQAITKNISDPDLREAVQARMIPQEIDNALDPKRALESVMVGEASQVYENYDDMVAGREAALMRTAGIIPKSEVLKSMYTNNRDMVIDEAVSKIPEDSVTGMRTSLDMEIFDAKNYQLDTATNTPAKFTPTELTKSISDINKDVKLAEKEVNRIVKDNLAGVPQAERNTFKKEVEARSGLTELRGMRDNLRAAKIRIGEKATAKAATKAGKLADEAKVLANANTKQSLYDHFEKVRDSKIDDIHALIKADRPNTPDWLVSKVMKEKLQEDRDIFSRNDLEMKNKNLLTRGKSAESGITDISKAIDEYLLANPGVVKGGKSKAKSKGESNLQEAIGGA